MISRKILLLSVFLTVFIWSAINPVLSYSYWLLENSPIIVVMILTSFFYKKIKLSDLSLAIATLYLLLPLIASHYGVAGVPFGETIGQLFGSEKNLYNRIVHFAFGLCAFYPIWEILVNNNIFKREQVRSYVFTFITIMALSATYEIFEWLAAISVNPNLAEAFYAAQEDIFDGQKDMALSAIGAIIGAIASYGIFTYNSSINKTS